MTLADRYLARLFATRFAACLLGFAAVVLLLDLLENATAMMTRGEGGLGAVATYAGLRLPLVLVQLVPIAALVGALLALARVGQTLELVAIKAAGRSYYRVLAGLVPVALAVAALHFALNDLVAPDADRALRVWLERTAEPDEDIERLWVRDRGTILAFEGVDPDGRWLSAPLIVERDAAGVATARTEARAAEHGEGGWVLLDATRVAADGTVTRAARLPWATRIVPDDLAGLARPAQVYALADLAALRDDARLGTRTRAFYQVQWHEKFAAPLAVPLMILIAAPVARGVRGRAGTLGRLVFGGAVAFCYLLGDGLAQVVAEAGVLPPALAAWAPTLVFAAAAGAVLVATEE
ncbi:MAG: LptF/LptG family permease [Alphaproteobacteria bacterium]|nr:LptF/LptG family permease [Alphaproteobacteria bacterium]